MVGGEGGGHRYLVDPVPHVGGDGERVAEPVEVPVLQLSIQPIRHLTQPCGGRGQRLLDVTESIGKRVTTVRGAALPMGNVRTVP